MSIETRRADVYMVVCDVPSCGLESYARTSRRAAKEEAGECGWLLSGDVAICPWSDAEHTTARANAKPDAPAAGAEEKNS